MRNSERDKSGGLNEHGPGGATVFFGGVAYLLVIFTYIIVWPQPVI